ncbi:MAG: hypothetical protein KGL39_42515 [Patescibacteria group bacterium]|nr:hypothetical protein [Patescibacteria group bacterium]
MTWTITTDETSCCKRTHHTSPDGQWRVTHSVSHFGLSDRFYPLRRTEQGQWSKLRVCRTEAAAWRAIERAIRRAEREARKSAKIEARRRERRNRLAKKRRRTARAARVIQGALFV